MQQDPIGYADGVNLYSYCGNNPLGRVDPSGLAYTFLFLDHEAVEQEDMLAWAWVDDDGDVTIIKYYADIDAWCDASEEERFKYGVPDDRSVGKELSKRLVKEKEIDGKKYDQNWLYERLQFLQFLGIGHLISTIEQGMKRNNITVNIHFNTGNPEELFGGYNGYKAEGNEFNLYWHPTWKGKDTYWVPAPFPPLVGLVHELSHAADFVYKDPGKMSRNTEAMAAMAENGARLLFKWKVPGWEGLELRPGWW